MKKIVAGMASLLVLVSVMAARPSSPLPHFQVTVENSAKGWLARCDTGCAWKELSVACGDDCRVRIDASGVTANSTEEWTKSTFGFVLSRSEKGGQAVSLGGTGWTTLSWKCAAAVCRARIDESGVTQALDWRFGRSQ